MPERKRQIPEFDFIRAVSALGIVAFHFACHTDSALARLQSFLNGGWGDVLVTVFFMLSGAVLYYHYGRLNSANNIYIYIYI